MSTNKLTIGEIIPKTITFLKEKEIPSPRLEADLMLAAVLKLPRVKLYSQWEQPLTPDEIQSYRAMILKRVQGWPLAYITGRKTFLSWEFTVTSAALIPRPETELLVEAVYDRYKERGPIRGVDVGTGSGIIAIALAKLLPESTWEAVDISAAALEVASQNANNLGVADRISLYESDLLANLADPAIKYDLIIANLPYIPSSELGLLQIEVQRESQLALDGGNDGLDLYRRLLPQAIKSLAVNGCIALEHGYQQRQPLQELGAGLGLNYIALPDLAGRDRVVLFQKQAPL